MMAAALVTGAGSGIGAAVARKLSKRGYFVFLLGRNERTLTETKTLCADSQVLVCDLNREADVRSVVKTISARSDLQFRILVNNAGIFENHSFVEGSDEVWSRQLQSNLLAPVRLTRELWPLLVDHKPSSIVNVSSTLGMRPTATTGAYSAAKAAMINWTQSLALEGGPLGVRVNAVCPGLVDTPIHSFHSLEAKAKAEALSGMAGLQPLGRIGTPEDVARSVAFFADVDSAWTTGAVLAVDGGINLS
jgi:NAD(P)-dependent dehydrogenase (short-subunit alcohol dehydrogenase family)